jgi:energy-coupling factor transport system ATP-binding protein
VRSVIDRAADEGRTVIAISHDMRFVAEAFARVIVMRAGRVILDGAPGTVFAAEAWEALESTYLHPPLAARVGAELGLGATPTDAALIDALRPMDSGAAPQV